MHNNCKQCGAPLATNQTFCRQCGTLTGVSGSDPTVMLFRPGPDTASPWAQVGTSGDAVSLPIGRPVQTSTLVAGRSGATTPFVAQQIPITNTNSAPSESATLDGEKTRVVSRATGPKSLHGWLVALTGNDAGKDWRIQPGKNSIGRSSSVDIALSDDSVSMLHAIIWVDTDSTVTLFDRDSSNGTFVNNRQIFVPTAIEHDALIRFGEHSVLQWVVFTQAVLA